MSRLLDQAIVGVLLLIAALYAFNALAPALWRAKALLRLGDWVLRAPLPGAPVLARRLTAAGQRRQAACGGCEGCGSSPPATATDEEIRVPINRIGRRS